MSRRYTPEEKQTVLQRLQANSGDVALTSAQTGVSERTLWRWQKTARKMTPPLTPQLTQATAIVPAQPNQDIYVGAHGNAPSKSLSMNVTEGNASGREGFRERITNQGFGRGINDPFDWHSLHTLLAELTGNALDLASSLGEVIDDAPLNQRAAVLAQIIDRIMKLAALLPPPKTEQVFRIEYVDPDGSIHNAPFWARKDSEE